MKVHQTRPEMASVIVATQREGQISRLVFTVECESLAHKKTKTHQEDKDLSRRQRLAWSKSKDQQWNAKAWPTRRQSLLKKTNASLVN
jgi:hypothetical protein